MPRPDPETKQAALDAVTDMMVVRTVDDERLIYTMRVARHAGATLRELGEIVGLSKDTVRAMLIS